jgi:hypothetical protein
MYSVFLDHDCKTTLFIGNAQTIVLRINRHALKGLKSCWKPVSTAVPVTVAASAEPSTVPFNNSTRIATEEPLYHTRTRLGRGDFVLHPHLVVGTPH